MLKSVFICTAIAAFTVIPKAHAQYAAPYGGVTTNDYSEWQERNRRGEPGFGGFTYDHDRSNSYQPYPSVTPSYGSTYGSDPYRSSSPYSSPYSHSPYGNDD
jgi:hypothetical protein